MKQNESENWKITPVQMNVEKIVKHTIREFSKKSFSQFEFFNWVIFQMLSTFLFIFFRLRISSAYFDVVQFHDFSKNNFNFYLYFRFIIIIQRT